MTAHPLVEGVPPAWASCWGETEHGPWAGFMIKNVVYRLFWCPPDTFVMGSPESEVGREDREEYQDLFEIQHTVTLTEGFWMAEHPCTQGLWSAVMGNTPSRFVDPLRPVERVSWGDAQTFLTRINEQQPGLELRLPTEAQWEYACRAGTTTATYRGNLDLVGKNNAPILNDIAWYGGNSGVEYELDEAQYSSDWPEQQFSKRRSGTRVVGTRAPNAWGLRDMLGNVWEWCQDWHGPYASQACTNPSGPAEGTLRVVRGGSWSNPALLVRAAYRLAFVPSYRFGNLGFRFSRGPDAPSKLAQEVEARSGAEPRGEAET